MKTIETKVFTYDELSDPAKQKAREWYLEWEYYNDWSEYIYEETKNLGFTIQSFDLDRRECEIKLHDSPEAIAKKIIAEHGKDCATYKTASTFIDAFAKCPDEYEDTPEYESATEEFTTALQEDYREMLQAQYDYIASEENTINIMEANEYTFTEDGKRFG